MTQTKKVIHPAEIHVREGSPGMFQLSAWDDELRPEGSAVVNRAQAELLMRDLAAALGFRVLAEGTAVALTAEVGKAVAQADAAKDAVTGHYDYDTGYQNAAQSAADDLRDLRDRLVAAGVTNR